MAKRYAIVVADSGYKYGVNALVNSLKYYGNDVDFHHLCWGPKALEHSGSLKRCREFNIITYDLKANWRRPEILNGRRISPAWVCKFYRYIYCATEVFDYAAVALFDADMMVTNNIMGWFEVAEKTKKMVMVNNDLSRHEHDCYKIEGIGKGTSPPVHNMPMFFDPFTSSDIFLSIPEIHVEVGVSDMSSLNHALIRAGKMEDLLILPNCLWLVSYPHNIKLVRRELCGKLYLMLHNSGDRVNAVHKPWWVLKYCERVINQGKDLSTRAILHNNIKLFWETNKFFNTELYHKVEWEDEVLPL